MAMATGPPMSGFLRNLFSPIAPRHALVARLRTLGFAQRWRRTCARGPCRLNAAYSLLGDGRFQLPGMTVVHHDRDVATGIGYALEQPERIIGIRISDEAVRPVRGALVPMRMLET